jgi:hypothetical protein
MPSRDEVVRAADNCTDIGGHVTVSVQQWPRNRTSTPTMQ